MATGLRVGTDLLLIGELDRLSERPWFLAAWYTDDELAYAGSLGWTRRREFLSGRFAAKEAVAKLLGARLFGEVRPCQIEVARRPTGEPLVRLADAARARAADIGLSQVAVSISHKRSIVLAVAVGSCHKSPRPSPCRP
jgi:phosphopantetheine--protein transferase-like protein